MLSSKKYTLSGQKSNRKPKTEFVSHEIQIIHDLQKSYFSIKKFTFSSFMELEVFFPIIQQIYSKICYKFYE
jgi:hypothetical protein